MDLPPSFLRPSGALRALSLLLAGSLVGPAQAQFYNDPSVNPEGNAGLTSAQVQTGGGYSAHSGNASRRIQDLAVAGDAGRGGLDFSRTWNSTGGGGSFGYCWRHSFHWRAVLDYEWNGTEWENDPKHAGNIYERFTIRVQHPDGGSSTHTMQRNSAQYSGPLGAPPLAESFTSVLGQTHYLRRMKPDGSVFWLFLADGGAVRFRGSYDQPNAEGFYEADLVIDQHGFATLLQRVGNILWVIEAGTLTNAPSASVAPVWSIPEAQRRRLRIEHSTPTQPGDPGFVLSVEAWSGNSAATKTQRVSYTYSADGLAGANYEDDPGPGQYALYRYDPLTDWGNVAGVINAFDDPRVEGHMTRVLYKYRATYCLNPNQSPAGGTSRIDYHSPSSSAVSIEAAYDGPTISSFFMPCNGNPEVGLRKENTGIGGERWFTFGFRLGDGEPGAQQYNSASGPYWVPPEASQAATGYGNFGYELGKVTDFVDPSKYVFQRYYHGFPRRLFDERGIFTELITDPASGRTTEVWHRGADNTVARYNYSTPGNSAALADFIAGDYESFPALPNRLDHHLFSQTDERLFTTTYTRDAQRRITRIDHPDGSFETFSYNDRNQVLTHRLASGTVLTNVYDGRGLLLRTYNDLTTPGNGWDDRVEYSYYTTGIDTDRLWKIQDGRARAAGKEYSARFTYFPRGQVKKVFYPATDAGPEPFVAYAYDRYGNCTQVTNELGFVRSTTYDEFRRPTSYTEALDASTTRTWTWYYDRLVEISSQWVYASDRAHTDRQWRVEIGPGFNAAGQRRMAVQYFDRKHRVRAIQTGWVTNAAGEVSSWTASADLETHWIEYDAHGNKTATVDALGRRTTMTYDLRNRLATVTDPLLHTTTTAYNATGQKTLLTFADTRTQQFLDIDAFGQPWRVIDERGNTTNLEYQWGPMKKLARVITHRELDGGGQEDQPTVFGYDGLGRETQRLFPDGSTEQNVWRYGALYTWKNRKGALKTIDLYDARGRETHHAWSDGTEGSAGVTRTWDAAGRLVSVANAIATLSYTYDRADQVLSETSAVLGAGGSATVTYVRHPDGSVRQLTYPDGTLVRRDYNARGQLASTGTVDASGAWLYQAVQYTYFPDGKPNYADYPNGRGSNWTYDVGGRLRETNTYSSTTSYAYRRYERDVRDRIVSIQKLASSNPSEHGKFDVFAYDEEGQLTGAWYEASDAVGNGWARKDAFVYDKLGNRMGANWLAHAGAAWTFTRRNNGLNQIGSWGALPANFDDMAPWGTPPAGNGVQMQDGNWSAGYDALNRPTVSIAGVIQWYGYDPLGRCVKRWQGGDGNPALNPATYLYYDGWNLIQEGSGAGAAQKTQIYLHGARVDEIVARYHVPSGRWYTHHYDGRTHCVLVLYGDGPQSGSVAEQYAYDAFGRAMVFNAAGVLQNPNGALAQSAIGNRFLFTGREWLVEWGVYDYRHRHYHPLEGRFVQPDPKHFGAGDYNLYRYCHNDPVNKCDPDGQFVVPVVVIIAYVYFSHVDVANAPAPGDPTYPTSYYYPHPRDTVMNMNPSYSAGRVAHSLASAFGNRNQDSSAASRNPWKFSPERDLDWRGKGKNVNDALAEAFGRTGVPRDQFKPTKWAQDAYGKSHPTEYRAKGGAEVNVDWGHAKNGPPVPHVGWQKPGKGGDVGHILLDSVPYNRN